MELTEAQRRELRFEGEALRHAREARGLLCQDIGPVLRERWSAQAVGKWEKGMVSMPKRLWYMLFHEWGAVRQDTPRSIPFPEDRVPIRRRNQIIRGKKRPTWSVRTPYLPIRNPFAD